MLTDATTKQRRCGATASCPADHYYSDAGEGEGEPHPSLVNHSLPVPSMGVCLDDPVLYLWMLN